MGRSFDLKGRFLEVILGLVNTSLHYFLGQSFWYGTSSSKSLDSGKNTWTPDQLRTHRWPVMSQCFEEKLIHKSLVIYANAKKKVYFFRPGSLCNHSSDVGQIYWRRRRRGKSTRNSLATRHLSKQPEEEEEERRRKSCGGKAPRDPQHRSKSSPEK